MTVTGDGLVHREYVVEGNYRGILFGMELEFFTVDQESLLPRDCLDVLAGHRYFGTLIEPELSSQQVEVKNLPTTSLPETEAAISDICADLVALLDREGAYPLPVALYDAGEFTIAPTPRFQLLTSVLGKEFEDNAVTIAGDQVNIGAGDEAQAFRIYSAISQFLPEFLRFSAASPFRHGQATETASNRLDSYDASFVGFPGATGFPPALASLADYAAHLQEQAFFQHPSSFYKYARPMPQRGVAVEIRCIDKQPSVRDSLAFLALGKAIVNLVASGRPTDEWMPAAGIVAGDPAERFMQARRRAWGDTSHHRRTLDYLSRYLDEGDRVYFQALYDRLDQGSLADQMVRAAQRYGLEGMYRRIAERFVAPFR